MLSPHLGWQRILSFLREFRQFGGLVPDCPGLAFVARLHGRRNLLESVKIRAADARILTSINKPPSACAASSSVERCEPMKVTNQLLIMISFKTGLTPLPACVVGTTPGDQELTVIGFRAFRSLRSSS